MTDRFSEATREQQDMSPFICSSCGHPQTIQREGLERGTSGSPDYHDRFSEAIREQSTKNAFTCESCGTLQVCDTRSLH